jgi:Citrate lyase beta subunit
VSSRELPLHRSYLYVAGSDPHRFDKARRSGADAVILDLEDAVAPDAKPAARDAVSAYLESAEPGGASLHVRINALEHGWLESDLEAATHPSVESLRIPKAERVDDLRAIDRALSAVEQQRDIPLGRIGLTLIVESARGALALPELVGASQRVSAVALGATDFLADIGAHGADDLATLATRSQMVLLSRAMGLRPPIDSVTTDLSDAEAVAREARFARAIGFFGKSIIHPRQIDAAHQVFSPAPEELARARAIVAAADEAYASGSGATTHQGEFVDPAIVARCRALLARERTPS